MGTTKYRSLGIRILGGLPLGFFLLQEPTSGAQEDQGPPRPSRRIQLYPDRSKDLSPPEKIYQQTQSQKAEKARFEARAQLDAYRVELAWLADPMLFAQPPGIKAVQKDETFVVELRGVVSSNALRQRALELAGKYSVTPIKDKLMVLIAPAPRRASTPVAELHAKAERHISDKLIEFSQDLRVEEVYSNGTIRLGGRLLSYEDKVSVSRSLRRLNGCMAVENRCEVGTMLQDEEQVTLISSDGNLSLPGRIQEKEMGPVVVLSTEDSLGRAQLIQKPRPIPSLTQENLPLVEPKLLVNNNQATTNTNTPLPTTNNGVGNKDYTYSARGQMSAIAVAQSGRVMRPTKEFPNGDLASEPPEGVWLGGASRHYQGKPVQLAGSVRIVPKEESQRRFGHGTETVASRNPLARPGTTVQTGSFTLDDAPDTKSVIDAQFISPKGVVKREPLISPVTTGSLLPSTGSIEIEAPLSRTLPLDRLVDLAKKACGSYALDVKGRLKDDESRITIQVRDRRSESEVLRRVLALASFADPSVRIEVEIMH